ncbi:MAG: hypothetical protein NC541_07935 [bacterium]|nr:hypothetical protein [bacterium]
MFYNMYEAVHNVLGLHFWDLPALVLAAALAVILVVHVRNQRKREDDFDKEGQKQIEALRKELAKDAAKQR